jgi:hypothetical protein
VVENVQRSLAFDCPAYLTDLADWDLIRVVKHKDERAMEADFRSRNVVYERTKPTSANLLPLA